MFNLLTAFDTWNRAISAQAEAATAFVEGVHTYSMDYIRPLLKSTAIFNRVEAVRSLQRTPAENLESYWDLTGFNADLTLRYATGILQVIDLYNQQELPGLVNSWFATMLDREGEKLDEFFIRQKKLFDRVLDEFPQAVEAIESEYGFHFERQPEGLFAETERFTLHKVQPSNGIITDEGMKPMIIIPPFVLGANILAFLPGEQKSFAHCFANKGIPTYIRIMKDIHRTPAVQTMSLEDDARDTRFFCERVKEMHGHPVTLNGYCQGGFSALCNILTGELDNLVDSLITCVAPIDGTRSVGLGKFLDDLPEQFNDLAYGTRTLSNGNKIASGELMGWVYKLKGIENSGPLVALLRDVLMLRGWEGNPGPINKTIAGINYWLQNERTDIPLSTTEMSYRSYNIPIAADGTLPVSIFGRKLNLHRIEHKKIPWLLCYGETDELVEKEVALAPLDFIDDVEVTPFPKGHVAIATSWSHPGTKFALDSVFDNGRHRGPVRFHLDLAGRFEKKVEPGRRESAGDRVTP